tara:strand:- start:360 stop:662 length:303 start_codon:yes stop_codon:yes gene_type:complete
MTNKGLETLYEWQMNIDDEDGFECITHWDIKDTESVIHDLKSGCSNHVEILKRQGSNYEGEVFRKYYQINFANKSGELDETIDLPKYIQKYINKVKEKLN